MKISVVTICWNAERVVRSTLESTLTQNYENFEVVIIDGQSSDKTLEIIYSIIDKSHFPQERITIISEKDKGVYDAMNKGVRIAKGEYVLFMNCGDSFYNNNVLSNFDKALERGENADVYYGNTIMNFYEGKGVFHDGEDTPRNNVMPFIHQSAITRRSLLIKHPFDLSYRICADFELYYWMRASKCRFIHENFIVSCYDAREGLSENNPLQIRREKDRITGIDKSPNYFVKKIFQRCSIGLIQPIKNMMPRCILNRYFRWKKKYIDWL